MFGGGYSRGDKVGRRNHVYFCVCMYLWVCVYWGQPFGNKAEKMDRKAVTQGLICLATEFEFYSGIWVVGEGLCIRVIQCE